MRENVLGVGYTHGDLPCEGWPGLINDHLVANPEILGDGTSGCLASLKRSEDWSPWVCISCVATSTVVRVRVRAGLGLG